MRSMQQLRPSSALMLPGHRAATTTATTTAMRRRLPPPPPPHQHRHHQQQQQQGASVGRRTPLATWRVQAAAAADGTSGGGGGGGRPKRSSPKTVKQLDSLLAERSSAAGDDFSWAAAADQRSDTFRERGVGAAAGAKAPAKGGKARGRRVHVEGPQKGGAAAPRSQRHAAVRVDRAASVAKRQKKAKAAAAAVAAGPGAQGKSFRDTLKTLHTPDEVLEAAAAADVEFLSGGNVAAAMSQVVRLARRQQITHTTDTRPLARRCTPLVARAVQVIEQEAADEQAGKAPQRRRMALRQVVDVVRALAALDAAEEVFPQQLEVLLAAACARIVASDSPSPQVNELVWALARARHMPGPPVREAIDHWLQTGGFAALPADRAVAFLWAAARLHYATPVARAALHVWQPPRSQLQPHQLVASLWALAILGQVDSPSFRHVWAELLERELPEPSAPAAEKVWSQLHHVWMAVVLDAPTDVRESLLASEAATALAATCNEVWWAKYENWTCYPSSYHRDVEKTLCTMGIHHHMEWACMGHVVDIALPSHGVVIEIDGPSHFAANCQLPLGPTLMKRRHLAAQGWRLMDVPWSDWDMLPDARAQASYLDDRLQELGSSVVPPGSGNG